MKFMELTALIGNTPLVSLEKINPNKNVDLYGKLEGNNPGGSVKDRAAYNMIQSAFDRGELKKGMKLIEATSGNTGIALAMVSRLLGVGMELVMPDNASKERIQTMEAYGAKVWLTPVKDSMEGAIDFANAKVAEGGYLMLNQFGNEDNWKAHYKTTGPEIWKDTDANVTHFVSAMGTTGTIMGVSSFLKEKNSEIQICGVQPTEGSSIPGIRRWPKEYLPAIYDEKKVDRILDVSQIEATEMTHRLALEEGLFCGMSSGGSVASAIKICEELSEGVVVAIICDRGDRYLSTGLFKREN
jgi:S-sulfo-L-cysteine synthase (O-acetyl-L-serine-dependent)